MKKEVRRNVTYKSLYKEREYGFFVYSGIWQAARAVLIGLTVVVVLIGLGYGIWRSVYDEFLAPVNSDEVSEIEFQVESGQSLTRVASNLESSGLIRSKTMFKYYCDFAGFGQKIQAGDYRLRTDMTFAEIADQLTRGDGNPLVRNITMIPGWSVEEFADRLVKDGVLKDAKTFLELCRTGEAFRDYYYIADLLDSGRAAGRKYVLEGYLAANTYEIYTSASEEEMIRRLLSQTERVFPADDQDQAEEKGFTMDQILTLASLIEKEAGKADFAKVSAVFQNRLKSGMRLQSDVTIHYITGVRRMHLTESELNLSSPYNTYANQGLPLGPICSPSREAIEAALNPDPVFVSENYLYFCAKDPESGELYFSKTLQEHEQAVAAYAPLWDAYDQARGLQ